jgi:hypothetical protein
MGFQKTVRLDQGYLPAGEFAYDGPRKSAPYTLNTGTPANNIIGATAFTQANTGGTVAAGGMGIFVGILANPKVYASLGSAANGTLAPTMVLPNNVEAELVTQGLLVCQMTNTNVHIGDEVHFVQATGAMLSVAPGTTPAGGNTKVPNATIYELPQPVALAPCVVNLNN